MKYTLMTFLLLAAPALAQEERFKQLPSDEDQQQMEETLKPGSEVNLDEFLAAPETFFWVDFYRAAEQLFTADRKDEALLWFYAGQIRGRVAAGIDPDPSRNNALLTSLNYAIGRPIREYAKSDTQNWVKQIGAALAWDEEHSLPAEPAQVIGISQVAWDTANFNMVYDEVREGLRAMRNELAGGELSAARGTILRSGLLP